MKAEAWRPVPPVRAVATPGDSSRIARRDGACRASIRSRSKSSVATPSVESKASPRVALTTTRSRTGAGESTTSRRAAPPAATVALAAARASSPGASTEAVYSPGASASA